MHLKHMVTVEVEMERSSLYKLHMVTFTYWLWQPTCEQYSSRPEEDWSIQWNIGKRSFSFKLSIKRTFMHYLLLVEPWRMKMIAGYIMVDRSTSFSHDSEAFSWEKQVVINLNGQVNITLSYTHLGELVQRWYLAVFPPIICLPSVKCTPLPTIYRKILARTPVLKNCLFNMHSHFTVL